MIPRFLTLATQSDPGPERTVRKLDPAWMRETFELNLFGHVQMTSELYNSGSVLLLGNPHPVFRAPTGLHGGVRGQHGSRATCVQRASLFAPRPGIDTSVIHVLTALEDNIKMHG